MLALRFALLTVLLIAQEPGAPTDFAALATRCTAGGEAGRQALERLPVMVAADYAAAHATWRSMPEGPPRTILANCLGLPLLDAGFVVITGALAGVEAIQGGVVDHHTVLLTFREGLTVHRATPDVAQELEEGRTFAMLRGTSHDTWLASVLVQQMRATAGVHTFVFRKRTLQHVTPAGALPGAVVGAAVEGTPRTLLLHECHLLPAPAGRVALGSPR